MLRFSFHAFHGFGIIGIAIITNCTALYTWSKTSFTGFMALSATTIILIFRYTDEVVAHLAIHLGLRVSNLKKKIKLKLIKIKIKIYI